MQPRAFLIVGALLAAGSCAHARLEPSPGPEIVKYLDEALQVIRAHALTSDDVDWSQVRRDVLARASSAKTTAAAYPALRHALAALNDNHSFLQLSTELEAAEAASLGRTAKPPRAAGASRPPSPFGARTRPEAEAIPIADQRLAGYLVMPQGRRNSAFAQAFQQSVGAVAARQPCGWVVDLRGNGGGDMWPMLAGLGPLLGDGAVGGSVDAAGRRDHWVYERGEAIFVDAAGVRKPIAVVAEPVTVTAESIAVLIDRGTAGSGEAIALAFRGDTRARLFGETTYGASTATRGFKLSDGANLVIAVSTFIDRSGRPYPHGVQPDVKIAGPDTLPSRSDDASCRVRWPGSVTSRLVPIAPFIPRAARQRDPPTSPGAAARALPRRTRRRSPRPRPRS
jgi:hypothetical protein